MWEKGGRKEIFHISVGITLTVESMSADKKGIRCKGNCSHRQVKRTVSKEARMSHRCHAEKLGPRNLDLVANDSPLLIASDMVGRRRNRLALDEADHAESL